MPTYSDSLKTDTVELKTPPYALRESVYDGTQGDAEFKYFYASLACPHTQRKAQVDTQQLCPYNGRSFAVETRLTLKEDSTVLSQSFALWLSVDEW
mgnify:CR=1 FL=1